MAGAGDRPTYRFYGDLASWWPLVSAPEEYAEEAAFAATLLRTTTSIAPGQRPAVLELGSGGGSNAYHLKAEFNLTLVDLSPEMIAVSQRLNPECEHLVGDMRTVRLADAFDASSPRRDRVHDQRGGPAPGRVDGARATADRCGGHPGP